MDVYENKDPFVRADAPPPPQQLYELARPFVDRAVLRFKGVKKDLDRIASAVFKAREAGQLSPDAGEQIWWDRGHVLTAPLQQRYLDARQFELLAAYHRARDGIQMMDWPDAHARAALEGFIARDAGDQAAALARYHIDRMIRKLRQDWRERTRGQPKKFDDGPRAAIRATQQAIIDRIPSRNAEMLLDIASAEPFIVEHGGDDDRAFLAAVRDEVLCDRERFPDPVRARGSSH